MWMKTKTKTIIFNTEELEATIVTLTAYEVVNLFTPQSLFLIFNGYNDFTIQ